MTDKNIKVTFAPGAFDNFDGTQEELDAFIEEIKNLALSGDLYEKSTLVDMETLAEDDPETYLLLAERLDPNDRRKLN